jgi:hypothetical protein
VNVKQPNIKKKGINMEWLQILTIIGSNLALFVWARTEARHDQQEIREIIRSIQEEMKDFHGRLCAIEERNKK